MTNKFINGLLTYLNNDQLEKIQKNKIGIAGLGGLGSNIANILVRTGFINFELIDFDLIEPSNLNRQNYFLNEVGLPKVEITALRLKHINPEIKITQAQIKLTKKNINNYFQDCNVIFEAFDNVESKKLILETFGNSNKLLIFGNGMAGITGEEIRVKQIKKNIFLIGDGLTEVNEKNPPLAPRVIICAAKMSEIVIQQALGTSGAQETEDRSQETEEKNLFGVQGFCPPGFKGTKSPKKPDC